MRVLISVRRKDINDGRQGSAHSCAVARAIDEYAHGNLDKFNTQYKHFVTTSVTGHSVRVNIGGTRFLAVPSKRMNKFIADFDCAKSRVKPSKFVLDFQPC